MAGVVESVNVGTPREVSWRGQTVTTAIWKSPVQGRVRVRGVNVDGDRQANLEVHGGVDKALYAYAVEDQEWWGGQLGREYKAHLVTRPTPNPNFRRVDAVVLNDFGNPIITLSTVLGRY